VVIASKREFRDVFAPFKQITTKSVVLWHTSSPPFVIVEDHTRRVSLNLQFDVHNLTSMSFIEISIGRFQIPVDQSRSLQSMSVSLSTTTEKSGELHPVNQSALACVQSSVPPMLTKHQAQEGSNARMPEIHQFVSLSLILILNIKTADSFHNTFKTVRRPIQFTSTLICDFN
jgi:hypothetical protein